MKPATPAFGSHRFTLVEGDLFPALLGLWIALALIKFGNPVILDHQIPPPGNLLEFIHQSWPVAWGYVLFGVVVVTGIFAAMNPPAESVRASHERGRKSGQRRLLASFLPWLCLAWLGWQFVSALQTVSPPLTRATLPHFVTCALCFLLGHRALTIGGSVRPNALWLGIAGGWLVVVCLGWRQHFGGLAETREYFYSLPNWRDQSAELIAKVASDRIYSTLVYPNALAGVMLLFTPSLILLLWERTQRQARWLRIVWVSLPSIGAIGCLVWSGSKSGWLIATGLVTIGLMLRPGRKGNGDSSRRVRLASLLVVITVALGGFWGRYASYFAKGATSLSARGDYWKVATSNAVARPVFGTGPGTFMPIYRAGKPPGAEMTRLVHNDYLQQATDSGVIGGLLFFTLVGGVLVAGYRRDSGLTSFGIWLGATGMAIQSVVEFGLYIPALAWPWFLAMGFLVGSKFGPTVPGKTVDNSPAS